MEQAPRRHQCTCFTSITVPSYQPASQNITSKNWWSSKDSQGPLFLILCKPFASLRGDLQPVLGYKFAIIMQISLSFAINWLIKTSHYLMISNVIRHAVHSSLLSALFYDALANIFLIPTFTISLWQKSFLTSYFNAGFEAKIKIANVVFYTQFEFTPLCCQFCSQT